MDTKKLLTITLLYTFNLSSMERHSDVRDACYALVQVSKALSARRYNEGSFCEYVQWEIDQKLKRCKTLPDSLPDNPFFEDSDYRRCFKKEEEKFLNSLTCLRSRAEHYCLRQDKL